MISIEETKKILGDPKMSDEEAKEIRDACYAFVDLIWEFYLSTRANNKAESDKNMAQKEE